MPARCRFLLVLLLAAPAARAQYTRYAGFAALEGGAAGQNVTSFDRFRASYNRVNEATLLDGSRLSGLDRVLGGYGMVSMTGVAGRTAISFGGGFSFTRSSPADARFNDGSSRSFGISTRDGYVSAGIGQLNGLRLIGEAGLRKTKLRAVFVDPSGLSDDADPRACQRASNANNCLSGTYGGDVAFGRAGLSFTRIRRLQSGAGIGLTVAATVPFYTKPQQGTRPDGIYYHYFDVNDETSNCLYQTYGNCDIYFPNDLDPAEPRGPDNAIGAYLRGVQVRIGLQLGRFLTTN